MMVNNKKIFVFKFSDLLLASEDLELSFVYVYDNYMFSNSFACVYIGYSTMLYYTGYT